MSWYAILQLSVLLWVFFLFTLYYNVLFQNSRICCLYVFVYKNIYNIGNNFAIHALIGDTGGEISIVFNVSCTNLYFVKLLV